MAKHKVNPSGLTDEQTAPTLAALLWVGCAVWAYDGWAGNFFPANLPKDERLASYARHLTAVEINSTFYAVPPLTSVQRWAQDTPESFRFCPKFPKAITHAAMLHEVNVQTASFIGVIRVLGIRLGPLMLQLPPAFGPNRLATLQTFLAELPTDLDIAVEVRHPDWFTDENAHKLDQVLAAANAARVVFDVRPAHNSRDPQAISAQERKPAVPLVAEASQPFVVIRYIGSPVPEENEPYLAEWVPRLTQWLRDRRRIYFFAHCPVEEHSPQIAREVYQRVQAALVNAMTLPPLPWDRQDDHQTTQLPLF